MNSKDVKGKIISLFEKYGEKDYIGEEVSQLEHALQAAQLAEDNGEDKDMILAALLHDIGHLLTYESEGDFNKIGEYGIRHHESHGEEWLKRNGVRDPIPELVGSHVISKKWLCRDKQYYEKLSEASKHTLRDQGGPMTDEEEKEYFSKPLHQKYTQLRLYDDSAKVKGKKTKNLEYFLRYF